MQSATRLLMITTNVIHRVFRIRLNESSGTAFSIVVDGREYLVTARHIVSELEGSSRIHVYSNRDWLSLSATLVGHAPDGVDISVLALERQLTPANLSLEPSASGLVYGQDVYFLGFPYGFQGQYNFGPDGFPLAFVRKAIISQFDGSAIFLDGHNNPGLSGAPVVFRTSSNGPLKVAAVISGYHEVPESVYAGGETTPLTYRYNTGIIESHNINEALELIRDKPIGFSVTAA